MRHCSGRAPLWAATALWSYRCNRGGQPREGFWPGGGGPALGGGGPVWRGESQPKGGGPGPEGGGITWSRDGSARPLRWLSALVLHPGKSVCPFVPLGALALQLSCWERHSKMTWSFQTSPHSKNNWKRYLIGANPTKVGRWATLVCHLLFCTRATVYLNQYEMTDVGTGFLDRWPITSQLLREWIQTTGECLCVLWMDKGTVPKMWSKRFTQGQTDV